MNRLRELDRRDNGSGRTCSTPVESIEYWVSCSVTCLEIDSGGRKYTVTASGLLHDSEQLPKVTQT